MKKIKKLSIKRFLIKQIEKIILRLHSLIGIGTGAGVFISGEKKIITLLNKSKSSLCIFDVGSNKGQFLKLLVNNIKTKNYSIHCFEPSREAFQILEKSSNLNSRIILNNFGIGKSKTTTKLYYDEVCSGLASLTKRRLAHYNIKFNKSEDVSLDTIDNYCEEKSIDYINLLKLDIEGHELDALKGAHRMLISDSIEMISFEFGGCNIDTQTFFQDYWYFFKELNMKLYRITRSGSLIHIDRYKEFYEQFRTTNYLAINNFKK